MLRNIFGSHVPSDLLLLVDAQSIQIKKIILVHWQYATLTVEMRLHLELLHTIILSIIVRT
jgi:hypothetical protein